ncbi:hypothetical protein GCM10022377_18640 [Zhihengliuella alba]|uniref:Uncharacterized protein n=1 Tax=Zhihengliuella alba TaxID=547018 RepID=A0ABP7DG09_9MICC
MSHHRTWLRISLIGAVISGALALLLAGLTSILFQEIESPGDVTNAQDFGWRAVALAVLSVALFTVFLVGRSAQRRKFNKTQKHGTAP